MTLDINEIKVDKSLTPRLPGGSGGERQNEAALLYSQSPMEDFDPIVLARSEDPELNGAIISGETRYMASVQRGDKNVRATYVEVADFNEAFRLAVAENTRHGQPLTFDERKSSACRMHDKGLSEVEIAKTLRVSTKSVQRYLEEIHEEENHEKSRIIADTSLTDDEAAEKTGLSMKTVKRRRSEEGLIGQNGQVSSLSDSDDGTLASDNSEVAAPKNKSKAVFVNYHKCHKLIREAISSVKSLRETSLETSQQNLLDNIMINLNQLKNEI